MQVEIIKGKRDKSSLYNKTITIFLMSYIYPCNTGYLKRMDFLLNWMDMNFANIKLIIPTTFNSDITTESLNKHLEMCNELFLIKYNTESSKKIVLKRNLYKLFYGLYPPMNSDMVIPKSLMLGFESIFKEITTDYFLNTRNNFAGLVEFVPKKVKTIFDTQDIFTDMYRTYSMKGKNRLLAKVFTGYREKGLFFKTEIDFLNKYDKLIAISQNDFDKYKSVKTLRDKVVKIESIGFSTVEEPVSDLPDKDYDMLIVASRFSGTENALEWMLNEVAPKISQPLSLCIIGSISEFVENRSFKDSFLKIQTKGVVESVEEFYQKSKVVILPILEGTGTSVKGLEAMAYGAAIISTPAGVRFGGVINGQHALICHDETEFARSIEELTNDEEERKKLGCNALKYYNANFSKNKAYSVLDTLVY